MKRISRVLHNKNQEKEVKYCNKGTLPWANFIKPSINESDISVDTNKELVNLRVLPREDIIESSKKTLEINSEDALEKLGLSDSEDEIKLEGSRGISSLNDICPIQGKPVEFDPKSVSELIVANIPTIKMCKGHKTGIVHITNLPESMTADQLRTCISAVGPVDRMKLQEKCIGKKGKFNKYRIIDCFVEFLKKRDAKAAEEVLHGSMIGKLGKHNYSGTMWCVKYQRGLKWQALEERNRRVKLLPSQRMAEKSRVSRKKNLAYLARRSNVEDRFEAAMKSDLNSRLE